MFYEEIIWTTVEDVTNNLNVLWLTSWFFHQPRPEWHGAMQAAMIAEHPGKANTVFLPMIDLSASNKTCIYSTFNCIATQGTRYGFMPIITFDQPLWWKAMEIIANSSNGCPIRNIFLKLGGFHTLMSFVGSIGHIMDGTGLRDVFEVIYASNTTPHLLSRKAISRAVRCHILMKSALHVILLEKDNSNQSDQSDGMVT